ncbi:exonuclease V [Xylariomycetidae sp. FL0641]|nr:exonuclease V [Xylariomycetidae sp. FL0641]
MASSTHPSPDESDYGSDFSAGEEGIVSQLLQELNSASQPAEPARPSDPFPSIEEDLNAAVAAGLFTSSSSEDQDQDDHASLSAVDTELGRSNATSRKLHNPARVFAPTSHEVQYPDLSRALSSLEPKQPLAPDSKLRVPSKDVVPSKDARSPIERFRSFPKKPLTVTDLSSGAWCELQYWYTLTLLPGGKKTRTAAMKGGSRVHQTLEDQVHTTVQVSIATKEEGFALRLWNVIQGLRSLRDTGITRELEVWGVVQNQIVNGIIDELSYDSPNADFEEELSLASSSQQTSITDYLTPEEKPLKVYLTDVKTRGSEKLPSGVAIRPARVQLLLYHRLLGDMASKQVDYAAIMERYGLRPDVSFSDPFMAELGGLHDEVFFDADSSVKQEPSTSSSVPSEAASVTRSDLPQQPTSLAGMLRYRNLRQLIPLLESELEATFPQGASSLGDLLSVLYRHRGDGRILGNNSFPNNPEALDGYLKDNLEWWRGEREARGIRSIEETYKCHSCEFAEGCQWRKDKEADFLRKKRSAKRTITTSQQSSRDASLAA